MSETEVQAQAVTLLHAAGATLVYHTHDARRSNPGWPDLAAVVGRTLWCIECKTSSGILRPEQAAWLNALAGCEGVRVWLATPETLDGLATALGVTEPREAKPYQNHTKAIPEQSGPGRRRAPDETLRAAEAMGPAAAAAMREQWGG